MNRRNQEGRFLGELEGSRRHLNSGAGFLIGGAGEGVSELEDHVRVQIALLLPKINEGADLAKVLGILLKRRCRRNHGRQMAFPGAREVLVVAADDGMVQHVAGNVENVQSAAADAGTVEVLLHAL